MKPKLIKTYLDIAFEFSKLSHAKRLKVGSIIVKDDSIIAYGYNGMPAYWDNNCEEKIYANSSDIDRLTTRDLEKEFPYNEQQYPKFDNNWARYRLVTRPEVLHAEANAIAKVAKSTTSSRDASIFITHAPCIECSKLIFQAGITEVFYMNKYRNQDGIIFLKRSSIAVEHVESEI